MGESLHQIVMSSSGTRCRIYAPVGAHRDLLAYLVRRLLENGANSSFVNQIANERISPEQIARDPFESLPAPAPAPAPAPSPSPSPSPGPGPSPSPSPSPSPGPALAVSAAASTSVIRPPADLFAPDRQNSRGWDLTDPIQLAQIDRERQLFRDHRWTCEAVLGKEFSASKHAGSDSSGADSSGAGSSGAGRAGARSSGARSSGADTGHDESMQWRINPAVSADRIGRVRDASNAQIDAALEIALNHWQAWSRQPISMRTRVLRRAAELLEANAAEFFALCCREAGKTPRLG